MAIITADDILLFRPDADPRQVEALINDVLAAASAIPGFRPDEPDQAKAARVLKVGNHSASRLRLRRRNVSDGNGGTVDPDPPVRREVLAAADRR